MDTAEAVRDIAGRWAEAELHADVATLDRLMDEEFVAVAGRGEVFSKEQWLDRYRRAGLHHRAFSVRDSQVRVFGDTAVVVCRQDATTTHAGQPAQHPARITLIASHASTGVWRIIGLHLSPIGGQAQLQVH